MKILDKIVTLFLLAILPVAIVGCSNDNDDIVEEEVPGFVLESEGITVKIGAENKVAVDIRQGGGEYNSFILDEKIAKVEIKEGGMMVEGVANGTTSLIISDKYSRYRRLPVKVYTTDKLQLSHTEFKLLTPLGNVKTLKANVALGNGGYEASSDNAAVEVSVNDDGEISMTAQSKKVEFTANITVTDCTGLSAVMTVNVVASMIPFLDEELEVIMADKNIRYYYNGSHTDEDSYYTYLNETLENGKQRYGWDYYSYYMFFLDFSGGKSEGVKDDATFVYKTWGGYDLNLPVTLEIIKNDGKNIWGIFSYVNDKEEKLYSGYFCDTVEKE